MTNDGKYPTTWVLVAEKVRGDMLILQARTECPLLQEENNPAMVVCN